MKNEAELYALVRESYTRAGSPTRVAAAVSGGADSMAMLFLLLKLRSESNLYLHCVHVHHGLRDTADRDALFVRDFCSALDIPFTSMRVTVDAARNAEEAARVERYAALRRAASEHSIQAIALAHHMEDQAETILMHLMHGAGMAGLSGMRELSRDIWRPLLKAHRAELIQLLRDNKIVWCEDETNADTRITRNAIRLDVMPAMSAIYPGFVNRMAQTADILSAEDDAMRARTHEWLERCGHLTVDFCWCFKEPLLGASIALQRRIIKEMAQIYQLELSFTQTERFRRCIVDGEGKTVNLPLDHHAYVTNERVHLIPPSPVFRPLGDVKVTCPAKSLGNGVFTQAFDADMMAEAVLRNRQQGDCIQPLGTAGTQSLKQYMIDKHIDKPFRAAWPILAVGKHVMWVIGFGISQRGCVNANTGRTCFIEYIGSLPDGRENYGGLEDE